MGKGKQFELDVKNDINKYTERWVKAHRPDFSGSSTGEAADILIVWQANRYDDQVPSGHPERHVAYIELKKRGNVSEGNRTTVMSGSKQDQSGLEELQGLRKELPPWAQKKVGIKFPNRELGLFDAIDLEHHLRSDEEGWGSRAKGYEDDAFFDARLTPSDNISMVKPTLDNWPSSVAGDDDWRKICRVVGIEKYDFV